MGEVGSQSDVGFWRAFYERFIVETRYLSSVSRRKLNVTAILLIGFGVVFFGLLLVDVLQQDGLFNIDSPIQGWLEDGRSPVLTTVMIALAIVFGPVALPLIVLVVVITWGFAAKHAWRPLLLAVSMSTGVALALFIAHSVGRDRPPTELMLFGHDATSSFPSGHVLGAADFVLITAYLVFSRRQSVSAAVVGFAFAVVCLAAGAISRLYLGYHWATDALASIALSMVILGLVIAVDTWRTVRVRSG